MNWVFLVSAGILAALGHTSLKHGLTQMGPLIPQSCSILARIPYWLSNLYIWLGLAGLGLSFLCWLSALSHIRLNIGYPFLAGLQYAVIILLSWLLLGGTMTLLKIAGVVSVFIGIILLTY